MNYELYQQGPEAYIALLILSAIITILAYGAFPFIFAKTRNAPITMKKYRRLCYGINAVVMLVFLILNGGASNGAPYLLWTWLFSRYGIKELGRRGIMQDSDYYQKPNYRFKCDACGYQDTIPLDTCPRCGAYAHKPKEPNTTRKEDMPVVVSKSGEPTIQSDKVYFCRKCGNRLLSNRQPCDKCNPEVTTSAISDTGDRPKLTQPVTSKKESKTAIIIMLIIIVVFLVTAIVITMLLNKENSQNDYSSSSDQSSDYLFEDYSSDYYDFYDYDSEPTTIIPDTFRPTYTPDTPTYIPPSQPENTCIEDGCNNEVSTFGSYCSAHKCLNSECVFGRENSSSYCSVHSCSYTGCDNAKDRYGSRYCYEHTCNYPDCTFEKDYNSNHCFMHKCNSFGCNHGVDVVERYCYEHACSETYCSKGKETGSNYCSAHECMYPSCHNRRYGDDMYCYLHND